MQECTLWEICNIKMHELLQIGYKLQELEKGKHTFVLIFAAWQIKKYLKPYKIFGKCQRWDFYCGIS